MAALTNPKWELFAQGLATGLSATEAYVKAGYRHSTSAAARLCANVRVKERVAEMLQKAAAKAEVTAERIAAELALIGFANIADFSRIGPDGDPYIDFSTATRDQMAAIGEITVEDYKDGRGKDARDVKRVKFKMLDKRGALVDLGKNLGMFKEQVDHRHTGVMQHVHTDPDEARATIRRYIDDKRRQQETGTRH